ncbi:MBL fold metallo-hydrolase [Fictibacillus phosphorivorans]|uniref:MBL fold metallo-hydrolase n=1 Tax=Fictibacillus phosphorivorans TaxID=1221500 RepID=UPI00203D630A|nr:MBL fold metallo-hydrolase [Fictibacillus phosphorivorans]MCM3719221.1 MBL fold metallo-hydrolase [Fictibacillus phosphorivorans]MCM3776843.1 MBL fold metallo-hydrolase [Fictibacillus phosphorivorans]
MLALLLIAAVVVTTFLFIAFHPVFGSNPSKDDRSRYRSSEHYADGTFVNQIATEMATDFRSMFPVLKEFLMGNPNRQPSKPIPIKPLQLSKLNPNQTTKVTWFGHSSLMIELDNKRILLDPMFGKAPSPIPWFGNKRYSKDLPFSVAELPQIDLVLLSHDHYDHLDYGTIKKLKSKVNQFVVPLGVGNHLKRWGVEPGKIQECNWWEEVTASGLNLVCTPARHFSGRSLTNRNSTLWCSWVIEGTGAKIYFSGDSGYGPHFKEIGEKFGPFDLTLMECGQYHEKWAAIHMMPEETVKAHIDVKGKRLIPIHWGAFTLSLHTWTDPIERVVKAADANDMNILTPMIGEKVSLDEEHTRSNWWQTRS